MHTDTLNSEVDRILTEQRDESDARSIINEVERINMLEGEHQFRWIWELLQNARDEAEEGVDIRLELNSKGLRFEHNGKAFKTAHLLALLRKTSTKPINGVEGNTGKFGTGFVISHLLNKVVTINGVHENPTGRRRFTFMIDRTPENLDAMKAAIAAGIQEIREIDATEPTAGNIDTTNAFYYVLGTSAFQIALGALRQLQENLAFTMLVNPQVRSVEVAHSEGTHKYTAQITDNVVGYISFMQLIDEQEPTGSTGLLFLKDERFTIAVPTSNVDGQLGLLPLGSKARLFKDLPLIGTEEFYIPVILQHKYFQPAESRDGVRTKMSADASEVDDKHASTNRSALKDFVNAFPTFLEALVQGDVQNLHLLAESGLPPNVDTYYDAKWYQENIQKPIRATLFSHTLVKTVSGKQISIAEAKFVQCDPEYVESMYNLLAKWYPDQCPNESSYKDWVRIIEQETDNWPEGITINIQELVEKVAEKEKLENFEMEKEVALEWLQDLVVFLENSGNERLGHAYRIYPNQDGVLVVQNEIFHDTGLDNRFKQVSDGMGRRLQEELLPKGFEAKFVENFDEKDFLIKLNTDIGKLSIEEATTEQIQAVIDICCTFKSTKATRREQWYDLLHRLLPDKATDKAVIKLNEEYQWEPAEKCSLKYVCLLIQSAETLEQFAKIYFEAETEVALAWLNKLYDFVFRNEENKAAALSYNIVPTQDGMFREYTEEIFRENDPDQFDDIIKSLYQEYTGNDDPKSFLVNNGISNGNIRTTSLHKLSRAIDDLFNDRDSEDLVKEGKDYHELFLKLKDWVDEHPHIADEFFPIFSKKQPILYIKAFGGSNFSRLLKLNKTVDEIEKLAELKLGASELKKLDDAVVLLGSSDQLLQKANEMIDYADQIRWRQEVGAAAEEAFLEAIGEADDRFDSENPDVGKDFVIKLKNKEYSIEIKSAVEGKETVKMSLLQGEHAAKEKGHYALCVISRSSGQLTNKKQFIERAKFVTNIGKQIGDKVTNWRSGLKQLDAKGDVRVELDSKSGAVNVRNAVWKGGISFDEFIGVLKKYFELK